MTPAAVGLPAPGGPSAGSCPVATDDVPTPSIGFPASTELFAPEDSSGTVGSPARDGSSMPDGPSGKVELSVPTSLALSMPDGSCAEVDLPVATGLAVSSASISRSPGARADACMPVPSSWDGPAPGRSALSSLESASSAALESPASDSVENHPAAELASRDPAALDSPWAFGDSAGVAVCPGPPAGANPVLAAGSELPLRCRCDCGSCVLAVAASSSVMSMCHRTASGGSAPQIGSRRASAGSCLGAVSRYGHSRD
jgi:hypothetical protein